MALTKDIFFLSKSDEDWLLDDPVIPADALIFVKVFDEFNTLTTIRAKLGTGALYSETDWINENEITNKLVDPNGTNLEVILGDGTLGTFEPLTVADLEEFSHLVTLEEWEALKLKSILQPSFVAEPNFSLEDISIGDSVAGNYSFSFTKTNNDSFKDATGGNIQVSQGSWSDDGDFDLKSVSSRTIVGSSNGFSSATTITFTVKGVDAYDQDIDVQTFDIKVKYPIYAGRKITNSIASTAELNNLQTKLAVDPDGLEFNMNGDGSQNYFHLLIPNEVATGVDIRLQSNPGPNSAGFTLVGTLSLTIGSVTKTYNHYVTTYKSAGEVNILIRKVE